jgi:hypothetical protein
MGVVAPRAVWQNGRHLDHSLKCEFKLYAKIFPLKRRCNQFGRVKMRQAVPDKIAYFKI